MAAHIPKELNVFAAEPRSARGESEAATMKEQKKNAESNVIITNPLLMFIKTAPFRVKMLNIGFLIVYQIVSKVYRVSYQFDSYKKGKNGIIMEVSQQRLERSQCCLIP